MTIQQIQDAIDEKYDARQIINMIADYIQANPPDDGASGIDTVLAIGQPLQADRTIDLNGRFLNIGSNNLLIDPTVNNEQTLIRAINNTGGGNTSKTLYNTSSTQADAYMQTSFNDGAKIAKVQMYANATESETIYQADKHLFPDIVALDFANDGAAASGGVEVGQFYHTSGTLKIRIT